VLTAPDRVAVAPGKSARVKVVVARMDDGSQPLEIGAEPTAGVAVEPVTVAAGGTLADLMVTNSAEGAGRFTLVGKVAGKTIGRSHPIVIDASGKADAKESADEN